MTESTDVVVLVPGFLGFRQFGGFRYFADRVSATLRGALEQRLRRTVPVIPLTTDPLATLGERQEKLLEMLDRIDSPLQGKAARFHLVGHSTGQIGSTVKQAADRIRHVLEKEPSNVIRSNDGALERLARRFEGPLELAAEVNDGIVNSTLQLAYPDSDGAELAGIVVGDHADVLGHYDRIDPYVARVEGGQPLNAGLFHSGSDFGDDQFFALYERVADEICQAV